MSAEDGVVKELDEASAERRGNGQAAGEMVLSHAERGDGGSDVIEALVRRVDKELTTVEG